MLKRTLSAHIKWIGFALLFLGAEGLRADTTWVSGQVGGVWTVAGSPYVIVDSAWVNPDQGLSVDPGVLIALPDSVSFLTLAGTCNFRGTNTDSVRIDIRHSQSFLYSSWANTELLRFDHVVFAGAGIHALAADTTLVLNCSYSGVETFGSTPNHRIVRGTVILRDSRLEELSVFFSDATVHRCVVTKTLSLDWPEVASVDSLDGTGAINIISTGADSVVVSNVSLTSASIDMEGSNHPLRLRDLSCDYINVDLSPNLLMKGGRAKRLSLTMCMGSVSHLVLEELRVSFTSGGLEVRNNTFHYESDCVPYSTVHLLGLDTESSFSLFNNVFISNQRAVRILPVTAADYNEIDMHDNVVFGMEDPWQDYPIGLRNRSIDPLLDPNSHSFELRFDSPCINQGDPSEQDEDGTRSDVGVAWWDHRFNHPPVITTPDTIRIQWGEMLDLILGAVDEGDMALIPNMSRAGWLFAPNVLDEGAGMHIRKRVPYGAESCSIDLTAMDASGLADHETINILVYPRSELVDTVAGYLPIEHSPYHLGCTVTISESDTLTIMPGVTILTDSVDCMPSLDVQGALIAQGNVTDSVVIEPISGELWKGVEVDTAGYLSLSCARLSGAIKPIRARTSREVQVKDCLFNGVSSMWLTDIAVSVSDVQDSVIFMDCVFDTNYCLWVEGESVLIDRCKLVSNDELNFALVRTGEGNSEISDCELSASSASCILSFMGNLTVSRSLLQAHGNARAIDIYVADGDYNHRILNNTVTFDSGYAVNATLGENATRSVQIANNIFVGQGGTVIHNQGDTSSVTIENNCWICFDTLSGSYGNDVWSSLGVLIGVNSNGDSIDRYGNLSLDPHFANGLYELEPTSPCIDAGLDVGLPFVGIAPDIGWWEFQGVNPPIASRLRQPATCVSAFPNPFNSTTTLSFELLQTSPVEVMMYDVLGRTVRTEQLGVMQTGRHQIGIAANNLASGSYWVTVEANRFREAKKVVVVR